MEAVAEAACSRGVRGSGRGGRGVGVEMLVKVGGRRQGVRRHRGSVGGWKGGGVRRRSSGRGCQFFFRRRKTIGLVRTVSDQSDNVIIAINFVDRMVQILWICLSGLFNSSGDDKM